MNKSISEQSLFLDYKINKMTENTKSEQNIYPKLITGKPKTGNADSENSPNTTLTRRRSVHSDGLYSRLVTIVIIYLR